MKLHFCQLIVEVLVNRLKYIPHLLLFFIGYKARLNELHDGSLRLHLFVENFDIFEGVDVRLFSNFCIVEVYLAVFEPFMG